MSEQGYQYQPVDRGDGRQYDGPVIGRSPFESPTGVPLAVSPEAQTMVESGSTPYQPDVNDLMAQMRELENRVKTMQEERGIPTDPIAFAAANLRNHVVARRDASHTLDTTAVEEALAAFEKEQTSANAELLALHVDDLVSQHRALDLSYLPQLARDVRKSVLVKRGATDKQADLDVRRSGV